MANTILEKSFIPIEYFYGGERISISGIDTEDYYPAICRAQGLTLGTLFQSTLTDEDGNPLPAVKGTYRRGEDDDDAYNRHQPMVRLVFQPRTYFFSHTIEVVRQVHLLGTGSALGYEGEHILGFLQKLEVSLSIMSIADMCGLSLMRLASGRIGTWKQLSHHLQ